MVPKYPEISSHRQSGHLSLLQVAYINLAGYLLVGIMHAYQHKENKSYGFIINSS